MTVTTEPVLRQHTFALPTVAAAVPTARRRVLGRLAAWGVDPADPVVETALIVLSELLTNCVRHAAELSPLAEITLALSPRNLVIAVHDRHPHCPRPRSEPHPDGTGGWGLSLIAGLTAEANGSSQTHPDPDGRGKTMLVRLPRPR